MTFLSRIGMFVLGSMAVTAFALPAHAQFGSNLIVNPGAEAGAGSSDGSTVPVPGWSTVGAFTAVQYGAAGGFPAAADPGPPVRGNNFFAGGPDNAASSASQVIDVSAGAAQIDLGTATYLLTGFLGGFQGQGDNAVLSVTFRDAGNASLGTGSIGPVTAADRGSATGLLLRSTTGAVPAGTRNILVNVAMTRTDGAYNDGYADEFNLTLTAGQGTAAPEPATCALVLLGLGGLALRRRR